MAFMQCRIQYVDDTDPFNSTNFPEPTRPPTYTFLTSVPLVNQLGGVKKLLNAPHRVSYDLRVVCVVRNFIRPIAYGSYYLCTICSKQQTEHEKFTWYGTCHMTSGT